jgi:hypothetical protein
MLMIQITVKREKRRVNTPYDVPAPAEVGPRYDRWAHATRLRTRHAGVERSRSLRGRGLPVLEHDVFAVVLDANGTMLRVTAVGEVAHAGYTVLGWRVSDIAASVSGLSGKGVSFLRYQGMSHDAEGIWTSPSGDKVAWFADPDGNTLSLTQGV